MKLKNKILKKVKQFDGLGIFFVNSQINLYLNTIRTQKKIIKEKYFKTKNIFFLLDKIVFQENCSTFIHKNVSQNILRYKRKENKRTIITYKRFQPSDNLENKKNFVRLTYVYK